MSGGRVEAALAAGWRRVAGTPRWLRVAALALVVCGGFAAVVLPLFTGGGVPRAEISGFLPSSVVAGQRVRVDIALDNTGDSLISPVCVAMTGSGTHLLSANFQGLEQIPAVNNRACGGQLTAQETIGITLVFTIAGRGRTDVEVVPQQGSTVIGPPFRTSVTAS